MNDKDRIILAKAMGWRENVPPEAAGWWTLGKKTRSLANQKCRVGPPNPEKDANDDYAVLEYFRQQDEPIRTDFMYAMATIGDYALDYKIGNYARAALKVINA